MCYPAAQYDAAFSRSFLLRRHLSPCSGTGPSFFSLRPFVFETDPIAIRSLLCPVFSPGFFLFRPHNIFAHFLMLRRTVAPLNPHAYGKRRPHGLFRNPILLLFISTGSLRFRFITAASYDIQSGQLHRMSDHCFHIAVGLPDLLWLDFYSWCPWYPVVPLLSIAHVALRCHVHHAVLCKFYFVSNGWINRRI